MDEGFALSMINFEVGNSLDAKFALLGKVPFVIAASFPEALLTPELHSNLIAFEEKLLR
jgi:hypothetical protein